MPACMRVSNRFASGTLSNPESHLHLSLVDVITVTLIVREEPKKANERKIKRGGLRLLVVRDE